MSKSKRKQYQQLNEFTYLSHYNQIENYALSLFKWEGLPDSINQRFMELTMLKNGSVVWYEDPNFGLMAMSQMQGRINFYNDPIETTAWGTNYQKKLKDSSKFVIMWNNYARKPIMPTLEMYARRLTDIQRTIDVNLNAQKTPLFVAVDYGQHMTMKNAVEEFEGNGFFIYGDKKGFDPENIKVFKTDAPYVIDKLTDYKHDIWNECMTYLGIGNANQDKKERLVADEVSANDEQVEGARNVMLQARQDAVEKINAMFGTKISVDYKLNEIKESEEIDDESEED